MFKIRTQVVKKSTYARRLEQIAILEGFLDQVKEFKAFKKLNDLFYEPKDAAKGKWQSPETKTDYYLSVSNGYSTLNLNFSRKGESYHDGLTVRISEKTIPAIIEAVAESKAQYQKWLAEENEIEVYMGSTERAVEQIFEKELTPTQLVITRKEVVKSLRILADEVEKAEVEELFSTKG